MPSMRDDWQAALEEALSASSDEGQTSREIAGAMGVSLRTTMDRLRVLADSGRLGTGRRATRTVDGMPAWCPVYFLVAQGTKKPGKEC